VKSDQSENEAAMRKKPLKDLEESKSNPAQLDRVRAKSRAFGALAVGALAFGALAIGALAIGRLAIRRLVLGKARIRGLEIDELNVKRLRVNELEITDKLVTPNDIEFSDDGRGR
jgi:hypothetical protein